MSMQAEHLAQVSTTETLSDETEFLTIKLVSDYYAINILQVNEIIEIPTITQVPLASRFIRGVMNLRGQVVPVITLSERLGLKQNPITRHTCVVVIETGNESERVRAGVIADEVDEVLRVSQSAIEAYRGFGAAIPEEFISGIFSNGTNFITILDMQKILHPEEISQS